MKKPTVKYSKGEIGRVRIVEDFLPSPDRLVLREDNVKVTLSLSLRSVTFFKRAARQRRVPYQRMIRALVDAYAENRKGRDEQGPLAERAAERPPRRQAPRYRMTGGAYPGNPSGHMRASLAVETSRAFPLPQKGLERGNRRCGVSMQTFPASEPASSP